MSIDSLDWRKLVAEFVGTFTLVFIGAGAIVMGASLVAVALAHGFAIAVMVSAFGHISGGLFNPALTLGLWVTRRLDHLDTVAYIIVQLLGAIVGAAALLVLYPDVLRDASDLGTPSLGPGIDTVQGIGIEGVLTFFLMLVVFGTMLDKRGPALGGIAIGLVLTMDVIAGGALTGAAMNPARALGPALVSGVWDGHLVYWVGPIVGAVLAALLYHYAFMEQEEQVAAGVPEAPATREGGPV